MVQPKIAAAVKAWSPTKDPLPIHVWLHPWLPLMRSKLSPYYPEIRRKLAQALSSWQPEDLSALSVIRPWREVFDRDSMDKFLSRVIIPKLVAALRGLSINPQSQDISAFNAVMAWYGVLPDIHIVSLFRGEFFSKWQRYDRNSETLQVQCHHLIS
jgi:tuftelin-interacting protein 11